MSVVGGVRVGLSPRRVRERVTLCQICGLLSAREVVATDDSGNCLGRLCFVCLLLYAPHDLTGDELVRERRLLLDAVGELKNLLLRDRLDRDKWFGAWLSMTQRRVSGGFARGEALRESEKATYAAAEQHSFVRRRPNRRRIRVRGEAPCET